MWWNNIQNGEGSMAWENSDVDMVICLIYLITKLLQFYKGEWKDGAPHGYGEYTWSAFFNTTLTFPLLNTYQGTWVDGMRNGIGRQSETAVLVFFRISILLGNEVYFDYFDILVIYFIFSYIIFHMFL